ncbi:MAG TPA: DEAD/DEAH box helicase [Chthonomonadaceae bacterium]|nr:DEAD/DEAH box helicase [Chthonomonadaceae bacterium]
MAEGVSAARRRSFARLAATAPATVAPARRTIGHAVRHPIGWFDFDAPPVEGNDEDELEGATGASESAPLSPEADLLRRLAAILQPPPTSLYAPNGFVQWPSPLLAYQRVGVVALLANRALLLADDMGLGKSIQCIAALRILFHQQQIERALLVCPTPLLNQWQREFANWAPDLRTVIVSGAPSDRAALWQISAHVRVVGYETLRADVFDLRDSPVLRAPWDVVILDEASRIKNRETAVAIACRRIPRERRWALTGTPLENRIEDVASILTFLTDSRVSPENDQIAKELRRVLLRRRREDVLADLPPRLEHEITLELPPRQRETYDLAETEGIVQLRGASERVTITHVLELISRLKQICNADPTSGESAKLSDIEQRMRTLTAEGHRALIFSQFVDTEFGIGKAAERLAEFRPLAYTGSLSAQRRAEMVARFMARPEHKALLLSLRAGGMGLNLQAASYVFYLDRWWNPAIEAQATARAHRMGQINPVMVYRYTCLNTIEERIDALLKAKRRLFDEVVNDASLDLSTSLTERELFGLFGLPPAR